MRSAPTVFIDAAHNPAGAAALAQTLAEEFEFRFLVGVVSVMAEKDVDGILAALEPVFDQVIVTNNGSPRALDVESLALRAEERFGPERVIAATTLPDAIETATALVEESGHEGEGFPAAAWSSPGPSSPPVRLARCSGGIRNDRQARGRLPRQIRGRASAA